MSLMFSTKSRYALRLMADLAMRDGRVSLKEISETEGISRKYLEQISLMLVKANLIESKRGKDGGYALKRKPENISIGEIIEAVEGSIAPLSCRGCDEHTTCERAKDCPGMPFWRELSSVTSDFLESKHLSDLLEPK